MPSVRATTSNMRGISAGPSTRRADSNGTNSTLPAENGLSNLVYNDSQPNLNRRPSSAPGSKQNLAGAFTNGNAEQARSERTVKPPLLRSKSEHATATRGEDMDQAYDEDQGADVADFGARHGFEGHYQSEDIISQLANVSSSFLVRFLPVSLGSRPGGAVTDRPHDCSTMCSLLHLNQRSPATQTELGCGAPAHECCRNSILDIESYPQLCHGVEYYNSCMAPLNRYLLRHGQSYSERCAGSSRRSVEPGLAAVTPTASPCLLF